MTFAPITTENHQAWHGFLLGLAAYATYNVCDVFVKILSRSYPLLEVVFLCVFLSLPIIYAFARWQGGPDCMRTRAPLTQIFRGVTFFIYTVAGWYGIQHLPLANFYTFIFTVPLFTVLLAVLWLRERVTKLQIVLLLISFLGVVVAFHPDPENINFSALVVLGGTLAGALGQAIIRRKSASEGLGASIVIPEIITAALAVAIGFQSFIWPNAQGWIYFWIAAVLSGIGNCFLVYAFYKAPASQVTPTHYSQMIWGTLLGYFVFGDLPDIWVIAGAVIIIGAGIALARLEYMQTHQSAGRAHE